MHTSLLGVEGASGHVYTTRDSLPFSVEREWHLAYADSCTPDQLFVGLIDKVGQTVTPLTTMLGVVPAPMMVTRDFRLQIHPHYLSTTTPTTSISSTTTTTSSTTTTSTPPLIPGSGDHLWFRMYIVSVRGAYFKCEFEFRLVGDRVWADGSERDVTQGRDAWGKGRDRRPGRPFVGGQVGYMAVTRDPQTHRLRSAPPDSLPVAEWTARGILHASILAEDGEGWGFVVGSEEADGFKAEQVGKGKGADVDPKTWTPLGDVYAWRSRRTDNDSLGHTTVHRRPLPFYDFAYARIPTHRIAALWFECATEILPDQDCIVRGVRSLDGAGSASTGMGEGVVRARFVLDNGDPRGRVNRCGAWLVEKGRVRLKSAGGGSG
ncbi:hypothetical protein M427DRAFT_50671 [Gonapodya prolifera JEL478]|uniref:Uncharacterized protein n=1 Tax=Gonapodya prolifera (strain JEL478) TaxID=1344416 RepID=A0A139B0W0_GONPJ|nr:hypothetical protein M427DRAFT_50671 [Gonapodya prolifera JEL478]|eukprot:KXS22335.1 hypothetical protein M427DRAFT_50671 [Gonapodya prolifera JEL478]